MVTPDRIRRLAFCAAILGAHALVALALDLSGGIPRQLASEPLQVSLIEERQEPEPIEPPAPQLTPLPPLLIRQPTLDLPDDPPPQPELAKNAITLPAAPPEQAAAGQPTLVSEVGYVRPVSPRYPPESRRAREEGLVVLRVLVDEKGRAGRIEVHRSSGFPRLDAAAREAVQRALFRPYVERGIARAALVMIPVEFSIRMRTASNLLR